VEETGVQGIYQLNRARVVRGDKVILDDVTLSFPPAPRSASSAPTVQENQLCCG
jgi:hypothetical protein